MLCFVQPSFYSSARSPLRGTMPARLRMASSSAHLTIFEIITETEMLTYQKDALRKPKLEK